jgi:tetratricopeptide (TPR) repeat protein
MTEDFPGDRARKPHEVINIGDAKEKKRKQQEEIEEKKRREEEWDVKEAKWRRESYQRWEAYHKLSREEKIKSHKKILSENPNNISALLSLANFAEEDNDLKEAEQLYKKVLEINPLSEIAYMKLAEIYLGTGKRSEAAQLYKKMIEQGLGRFWTYKALAALVAETNPLAAIQVLQDYFDEWASYEKEYETDNDREDAAEGRRLMDFYNRLKIFPKK